MMQGQFPQMNQQAMMNPMMNQIRPGMGNPGMGNPNMVSLIDIKENRT